ncbi:hypothetical protein H5V45_07380 [Nocardioides sp. KIGAM211]|uniref:Uncharacterized protein n=1 Tax=Nocardioides luti TaxID=2761101 RepID=A0A7X0RGY3_9ACTN|nr:hypothetical protein [Nocardioides luti]MBB6627140.1 hypothetical protein [Nocardioides luti]
MPAPGLEHDCASFGPGHQLHWQHWKKATAATLVPVSEVDVDGTLVEVHVAGRQPFHWLHHDPARLRDALAKAEMPILASPQWQALRVDGYWFNCAPNDRSFGDCR